MLSDTKEGLVRLSCQESHQTVPSFGFTLQSIKSMKGTNQRGDKRRSRTLDFTFVEGYDGDGSRDSAVGERLYVAIRWCHRFSN